jgi:hypothetical protein
MNVSPASCRPAQRGAHMLYTSTENFIFQSFQRKNMIKKINLSGYLKKKNIRNNIYLGNKKNSKATIDQKKKKKKRNCEREKEQSLEKGKKKNG